MNFDWAQLFTIPSLLLGMGVGCGILFFLDKNGSRKLNGGAAMEDGAETIAKLQAELDATRENQAKVNEVHAYARTLEDKIQQLESVSDSADSELRVKVLEKQLSEKADLEAKLAVALQQLEDYKAKAEMYDTVVGSAPAPVAEPEPEPAPLPFALEEPVFVEEGFEEVYPDLTEISQEETVAEVEEAPEEKPLVAVASAEPTQGMTLVQNEISAKGPASPVGATAPAIDERPALRVESSVDPILDARDPLEKIEGIGQIYQNKLFEAGIKTFAQLAAASPSRITEVIEPQNWQQIDVMKWRREAALYASGERS